MTWKVDWNSVPVSVGLPQKWCFRCFSESFSYGCGSHAKIMCELYLYNVLRELQVNKRNKILLSWLECSIIIVLQFWPSELKVTQSQPISQLLSQVVTGGWLSNGLIKLKNVVSYTTSCKDFINEVATLKKALNPVKYVSRRVIFML
jgi:hypothetical protein